MRYIMIFFMLAIATATQAQTATPTPTSTPHNDALAVGMYQFEDLASPQIELAGTWGTELIETTETLVSSEDEATLTFHVTSIADYLVIYRSVTSTSFGTWSMCIDAMPCLNVSDYGTDGIEAVAIELPDTNSQVVITKTNDESSKFDFMTISLGESSIVQANIVIVPLIATPASTMTPDSTQYIEATDEVGETYYIRREKTITIADEANVAIGVMILLALLSILVVLIWKR